MEAEESTIGCVRSMAQPTLVSEVVRRHVGVDIIVSDHKRKNNTEGGGRMIPFPPPSLSKKQK